MSPTRYFLVQHDDDWMIKFDEEEFGPYKSKSEAEMKKVNHFLHAEWGGDSHARRHSAPGRVG